MKQPYLIANPIYDGVFKALMEDLEIARGFLSVVLGLVIESLRFTSRETTSVPPGIAGDVPGITASCTSILRLDFCAVIRTSDGGQAQVIIELPFDQSRMLKGDRHRLDYESPDAKLDKILARIVRQLHKPQTDLEMERIMSAEDLFEIEQQRIHEDLAQALFESEKLREEARRLRHHELHWEE